MRKNLFLFVLGGLAVVVGKRYSAPLGRAVIRKSVQVNRTVRQVAAEAINETRELAAAERKGPPGLPGRHRSSLPEPS